MKYAVLVPDGMADRPIEQLGGKTPLEVAETPNMDYLAGCGTLGLVETIPADMAPASDVANLSILGYDPKVYYTGRAPLEAAHLGIDLKEGEIAFRCNLVTVAQGRMADYSAGHITSAEAGVLIKALNAALGSSSVSFHAGVSYRHLVLLKGVDVAGLAGCACTPPHDILGKDVADYSPRGKDAAVLRDLMERSRAVLSGHEINKVRVDLKENPANMIWLWGQGLKPRIPTFRDKFGVTGSVISAVDLIKGMGKIMGLAVIDVPGATGYYDTDYEGKAAAGLKALKSGDFVFIHVEATDEAGHNGDLRMKITTIERFDKMVVGPFVRHLKETRDLRVMVLPDHATPVQLRKHVAEPVCAAWAGSGIAHNGFSSLSEAQARQSSVMCKGHELMSLFLR
ncbi:MAG: cofactor-independent phosphoglycerate mutase [Deltaproteobacteria bacterium]